MMAARGAEYGEACPAVRSWTEAKRVAVHQLEPQRAIRMPVHHRNRTAPSGVVGATGPADRGPAYPPRFFRAAARRFPAVAAAALLSAARSLSTARLASSHATLTVVERGFR